MRTAFVQWFVVLYLLSSMCLGCGGTCADFDTLLTEVHREQLALAGTGEGPISSGEHHLGLTYGRGLMSDLLDGAGVLLESETGRLSVAASSNRRRTAIRLQVVPRMRDLILGVDDEDPNAVLVDCEVEATITIRTGRAAATIVPGQFQLRGDLSLGPDTAGIPSLLLSITGFEGSLSLGVQALDEVLAEATREFVEGRLQSVFVERDSPIPLIRFPALESEGASVALFPTELQTMEEDGSIFIGLTTNLRPTPGGQVGPDAGIDSNGMSAVIHPDLPAAAARLSLINGSIPGRLGETLEPDETGPVQLVFDTMSLRNTTFAMTYQIWDDRNGRCTIYGATAQGTIRTAKEFLSLVTTSIEPHSIMGESLPLLSESDWLEAAVLTATADAAGRTIDLGGLSSGTGRSLALEPESIDANAWRIRIRYR